MIIRTNAKDNRKKLINALSEILNEEPHYCFAPSFAYEFSICRVDRDAIIHLAPTIFGQSVDSVAALLSQRGFNAEVIDNCSEIEESSDQPDEENDNPG